MNQPLSHTADPDTSYEAADRMVKSGALSRQEEEVWEDIKEYLYYNFTTNNFTARELANSGNLDYHLIQRRLSGLRNKGYIERIQIGKTQIGATRMFSPIYKKRDGCCVWRLIK